MNLPVTLRAQPNGVIQRLRLLGGWQDTLSARLRLESLLNAVTFNIPGLPQTALLVVDQLRIIESLSKRDEHRLSFSSGSRAWERTLGRQLASLAAQAVRPALSPVPPGVSAVVFLDETELLVSLARDLLNGDASRRWWWQAVYPSGDYSTELITTLLAEPQYLPVFIEQLAQIGEAAAFTRLIGEVVCQRLSYALLTFFQIFGLEALLETSRFSQIDGEMKGAPSSDIGNLFPGGGTLTPASTSTAKPLSANDTPALTHQFYALAGARVRAALPAVNLAARFLLILASAVHRHPTQVRQVAALFNQPVALDASSQPVTPGIMGEAQEKPLQSIPTSPGDPRLLINLPPDSVIQEEITVVHPPDKPSSADPGLLISEEDSFQLFEKPGMISTRFGGLFYLLNLAVFLGIYNDFTRPADPGWLFSPWDLLALLGDRWIGAELHSDPLWPTLERLAGRKPGEWTAELVLASFTPPEGWRSHLNLPHSHNLPPESPAWLDSLASIMLWRLSQAFGKAMDTGQVGLELVQPARVWTSSTRLDVHFRLVDHPLELRLAGLDRDLGWLPAAGRSIYYHYET